MNDAGDNHNTRLPWLRSLLPDDGDLTPAQAARQYGPPELVAGMNRLVELETARLFPPVKLAGETECDRMELNRWLAAAPPLGEREWELELGQVAVKSELSYCQMDLWRHLTAEGMAGRLIFSYQPTDPAAARVIIPADRCRYLTVLSPGTLFEGVLADAIHCTLRTPAKPDTLRLDGHELWHARIRPASEEAAIRARLASLKRAPTDDEAGVLAVELNVPQRAVIRITKEQIAQGRWPKRKRGRRRKPPVTDA